jgi:hypothetical protein
MDIETVLQRIEAIVTGPGFQLDVARDPFSPALDPGIRRPDVAAFTSQLEAVEGRLGRWQDEQYRVTIATSAPADPDGRDRLVSRCSSLVVAVLRDSLTGDYDVVDVTWAVPEPGDDDPWVDGFVTLAVRIERQI